MLLVLVVELVVELMELAVVPVLVVLVLLLVLLLWSGRLVRLAGRAQPERVRGVEARCGRRTCAWFWITFFVYSMLLLLLCCTCRAMARWDRGRAGVRACVRTYGCVRVSA